MKENTLRVVKIDKEAILEFIYENFIANEEELLGVRSSEVTNDFAIDWEKGEFIFTAHKQEDVDGSFIELPKEIEIGKLLNYLSNTTDSALSTSPIYKDYTFEELKRLLSTANQLGLFRLPRQNSRVEEENESKFISNLSQ